MRVKLIGRCPTPTFWTLATYDHFLGRGKPKVWAVRQAMLPELICHVVAVDEALVEHLAALRQRNTRALGAVNRNDAIAVWPDEVVERLGMAGEVAARTYYGLPLDLVQAGPDDGRDISDPETGEGIQVKTTPYREGVLYFRDRSELRTHHALLAVRL